MKARAFPIVICAAACLAALTCAWVQGRQLTGLRAERLRLVSGSGQDDVASSESLPASTTATPSAPNGSGSASLELLQLRSEVTRLTNRRRELLAVTNENAQLQARLRDRATNAPASGGLPPGYILRSKAQRVGFNTPEETVQSLLWAMHNRDFNAFLQALTPESVGQIVNQLRQSGNPTNEFFLRTEGWVGMGIRERRNMSDGSIEADVEIVPGIPPMKLRFELLAGQWKMGLPR